MTFYMCPSCDGSGMRNIFSGEKCFTCYGVGMIEYADPDDEYDEFEDYIPEEEQKHQSAMERGDYLRDRAKDEAAENRLKGNL